MNVNSSSMNLKTNLNSKPNSNLNSNTMKVIAIDLICQNKSDSSPFWKPLMHKNKSQKPSFAWTKNEHFGNNEQISSLLCNKYTHIELLNFTIKNKQMNGQFFVYISYVLLYTSRPIAPMAASTKKSQLFLIGRYLLENAEFTYIIVECFPVIFVDKNNIQFRKVSIKKVYNF